jgi:hypothetical protein
MAAIREEMDAMSWLARKADDAAVTELEKGTLDTLEYRYGKEMVPDMVEHKLLGSGVDFSNASDEQIFEATNELVHEEEPAELVEPGEAGTSAESSNGEPSLPSDDEMIQQIVQSMFDDSELRAALDAQWHETEIPADQFEEVVEELVDMIKEGLWDGLVKAMGEFGDTEPSGGWTEEQIESTLKQLG